MGTFAELAQRLHHLAKVVEVTGEDVRLPVQEIGINEALDRLKAVVGPNCCINPPCIWGAEDGYRVSEWKVWDGTRHYQGRTLEEALNACMLGHTPVNGEPLAVLEQKLAEVSQPEF